MKYGNFVRNGVEYAGFSIAKASEGGWSQVDLKQELKDAGWLKPIVQINHAQTNTKGTVRGMHYQLSPHAEAKLVSCIRGSIWDVAVDLRKGSKTFLEWFAQELSPENNLAMLIPEGFAHGFQKLTDNCELIYLHSSFFRADAEGAINVFDPLVSINWPIPVTEMSERDRNHSFIHQFKGIEIL